MATRFDGSAWSAAARIDDDTGPAIEATVAADTGADGFAGWIVAETTQPVKVARFTSGARQAAERVSADTNVARSGVRIVSPAAGQAVVAWREVVTVTPLVARVAFATRSSNAWSPPAPVYDTGATDQSLSELAVDSRGTVVAVWADKTASGFDVVASLRGAGGFAAPDVPTDTPSTNAPFPRIAAGPGGTLVVIWEQHDASGVRTRARRFDGTSWAAGEWLEPAEVATSLTAVRNADLVVDSAGRATAVWSHGSTVWANRFVP